MIFCSRAVLGVVVLRPEHLHLDEGAEEAAAALAPTQVPRAQDPDAQVNRRTRLRAAAAAAVAEGEEQIKHCLFPSLIEVLVNVFL